MKNNLPPITPTEMERVRRLRDGEGAPYSEQGLSWGRIASAFTDDAGRTRREATLRRRYETDRANAFIERTAA